MSSEESKLEEMRNEKDRLPGVIAALESDRQEAQAKVQSLEAEIEDLTEQRETLRRETSGPAESEAE